jgi:hypothetical protein
MSTRRLASIREKRERCFCVVQYLNEEEEEKKFPKFAARRAWEVHSGSCGATFFVPDIAAGISRPTFQKLCKRARRLIISQHRHIFKVYSS